MQRCKTALAVELLQSCSKPSKFWNYLGFKDVYSLFMIKVAMIFSLDDEMILNTISQDVNDHVWYLYIRNCWVFVSIPFEQSWWSRSSSWHWFVHNRWLSWHCASNHLQLYLCMWGDMWGRLEICIDIAWQECKPSTITLCLPPTLLVLALNSLWPSDAIQWYRTGSTLVQIMACCLAAPIHYLNQCWFIINGVLWHSTDNKFNDCMQYISS